MESERPQSRLALADENSAALDRLIAMLDYAEGLTILFASCNLPSLRDQLIDRARARLAALGVAVITLEFDRPVQNLRRQLRERLADQLAEAATTATMPEETHRAPVAEVAFHEPPVLYRATPKPVIFLIGLELSIPFGEPAGRLLAELNLGRELFLRDAPHPLAFWLPDYAVTAVARNAPDFWAWRSGVFEFQSEVAHRREAFARYVELDGDLTELSNLTAARKLQRQRILESMLDDYRSLPPEPVVLRQLAAIRFELANLRLLQGKPQEAIALYHELLATLRTLGDRREVASTQFLMADVLSQIGRSQEALQSYEESLRTIVGLGDRREVVAVQRSMADLLFKIGQSGEAVKIYDELLHTIAELNDRREAAKTLVSIANLLSQTGQTHEMMPLFEASLRITKELGDRRELAVIQSYMSDALMLAGRSQDAIELYNESLGTKIDLGDRRGVAVAQAKLAGALGSLGRTQEALDLYKEAVHTMAELGDIWQAANVRTEMADMLAKIGQTQAAAKLYEESLRSSAELGDRRSEAIVKAKFGLMLVQNSEEKSGLAMLWAAWTALDALGYTPDAEVTQKLIATAKFIVVGPDRFNVLWETLDIGPQPAWLVGVQPET